MFYPAKFILEENGGYSVSFRDIPIPEALTCGDTLRDAKEMAQDELVTAMEFYLDNNRTVPMPSPAEKGEVSIELSDSIFAKVLLLNELVKQNISKSELARRISVKPQEVQRISDLRHHTKIGTISKALKAVGKCLVFSIA